MGTHSEAGYGGNGLLIRRGDELVPNYRRSHGDYLQINDDNIRACDLRVTNYARLVGPAGHKQRQTGSNNPATCESASKHPATCESTKRRLLNVKMRWRQRATKPSRARPAAAGTPADASHSLHPRAWRVAAPAVAGAAAAHPRSVPQVPPARQLAPELPRSDVVCGLACGRGHHDRGCHGRACYDDRAAHGGRSDDRLHGWAPRPRQLPGARPSMKCSGRSATRWRQPTCCRHR